jgi:nucleoside-diphosphate-sugar epimerase
MNTILITGGSGFVGKHLVARLKMDGKTVIAPLRKDGFDLLKDELPLKRVDHVVHLAALTGVVEAWEDPVAFHNINAHGTMRVLEQCRRSGCSVTYASAYVYGHPEYLPIDETAATVASNPYAFSKLMAEEACRFYERSFNLPVTILRIFNVFGPEQSDRFLLPHIIRQLIDPNCFEILVKDLNPRRDYVYIDDVIDAIIASIDTKSGGLYNVGSGKSYSVEEVIQICLDITLSKKTYGCPVEQRRKNELDDVVADISHIKRTFGWCPKTSLRAGLSQLIDSTRQ